MFTQSVLQHSESSLSKRISAIQSITKHSFAVIAVLISSAFYSSTILAYGDKNCYVKGNTQSSSSDAPAGSKENPYSSFSQVQADLNCERINVLYSDTELDGGIYLRDGQSLSGKKSNAGELPVLTGGSIVLARDNHLKNLHLKDMTGSAILGTPLYQPIGGKLKIHDLLITGANQSGNFRPALGGYQADPSILLAPSEDINISINNSDIGQSNVPSIIILSLAGYANVEIEEVLVRDQAQVSENWEISPGISVIALNQSSLDVTVKDTHVDNIGSAYYSNSDGMLLMNFGSGNMTAEVDGYHYTNPDNGGLSYSSTGIEVGLAHSSGGGTFNGKIKNSVIEDAFMAGIQVIDQDGVGMNRLNVEVVDNQVDGSLYGIMLLASDTPYSNFSSKLINNTVNNSLIDGLFVNFWNGPLDVVDVFVESNTFENSARYGMYYWMEPTATFNSLQLDAGLGTLGSAGNNRIIGSGTDVNADGKHVYAMSNWWGNKTGPSNVVEVNGGTIDVEPHLTRDPKKN